jgi:transmembrane sensor
MTQQTEFAGTEPKDAMQIRLRAGEWLVALKTSEAWSSEDQKNLDQWLAQSPENLLAFWRLEASWDRSRRLSAIRHPGGLPPESARGENRFAVLRNAVAVILLIIVGVGTIGVLRLQLFGGPNTHSYSTGIGGHEVLKLADGSTVELTTSTAIRVAISPDRHVWLDQGEAYFQVVHDAAHPFVLEVQGQRITDLGTKFSVRRSGDQVDVIVADGKIRLESSAEQPQYAAVFLTAGQAAIASARSVAVQKRSVKQIEDELAWRRDVLVFDETPLRKVAEEFNRYNATKLIVADEDTANMDVGGTFPTAGVDSFIRVAKHVLNLRAEKRGDQVILSR